eukprot:PhF_6_TR44527/c3_g1_i2/m.68591
MLPAFDKIPTNAELTELPRQAAGLSERAATNHNSGFGLMMEGSTTSEYGLSISQPDPPPTTPPQDSPLGTVTTPEAAALPPPALPPNIKRIFFADVLSRLSNIPQKVVTNRRYSVFVGNLRYGVTAAQIVACLGSLANVTIGPNDLQLHYYVKSSRQRGSATLWVGSPSDQLAIVAFHNRLYFTEGSDQCVLVADTVEHLSHYLTSTQALQHHGGPRRAVVLEMPNPELMRRHSASSQPVQHQQQQQPQQQQQHGLIIPNTMSNEVMYQQITAPPFMTPTPAAYIHTHQQSPQPMLVYAQPQQQHHQQTTSAISATTQPYYVYTQPTTQQFVALQSQHSNPLGVSPYIGTTGQQQATPTFIPQGQAHQQQPQPMMYWMISNMQQ